jgi:hypothetical protein
MTGLAWLGALAIGMSLGLLGSGGSTLTVPVLVYVVGQDEKVAIASSLAIVGGVALCGAIAAATRGRVDWRSVVWFGAPGAVGSWFGSWASRFVRGEVQLTVFGLILLLAAFFMARRAAGERHRLQIVGDGFVVGALTGFVGVGGGFLILPALVLLGGLSMQLAVGTSLAIIAINATSGFLRHFVALREIDRQPDFGVIAAFVAIGAVGAIAGNRLGSRLPQALLRQIFAVFLIAIAGLVLWRQIPLL